MVNIGLNAGAHYNWNKKYNSCTLPVEKSVRSREREREKERRIIEKPYPVHAQVPREAG